MKISIIVPMYNSKKTIKKLIDSVETQTYKNYELILVDDGSVDDTYDYVSKLISNKQNVFLYKIDNSGPGIARKFGYQKSNGELIFFVDSDDWVTHNSVFEKINNIFKKDVDVLFFDREDIVNDDKSVIVSFKYLEEGIHGFDEIKSMIRPGLGSKIFKRELLKENMFYNSNVFEDLYTTFVYLEQCKNFYYIKDCFYTIYHEDSTITLSSNIDSMKFSKSLQILLLIYNKLKSDYLKNNIKYRIINSFYSYLKKQDYKKTSVEKTMHSLLEHIKLNDKCLISKYDESSIIKYYLKSLYIRIMLFYYKLLRR